MVLKRLFLLVPVLALLAGARAAEPTLLSFDSRDFVVDTHSPPASATNVIRARGTPNPTSGVVPINQSGTFVDSYVKQTNGFDIDLPLVDFDPATSGGWIENSFSGSVAFGRGALRTRTADLSNVALGSRALASSNLTNGVNNTAVGVGALEENTGDGNTAVGEVAGNSNVGAENVFIGRMAGQQMQEGSSNVVIGAVANSNQWHTKSSVIIGHSANASSFTNANEIVIGTSALGHGSDTATIGNANVIALYVNGVALVGMTKAQKTALPLIDGLLVYQTDNTPGLRAYVNGAWQLLSTSADP